MIFSQYFLMVNDLFMLVVHLIDILYVVLSKLAFLELLVRNHM